MAVTVDDLERRVIALEKAQSENASTLRWAAGTLGQIQAVQDDHTQRLNRVETVLGDHTQRLDRLERNVGSVEHKLDGLIQALPQIVGDGVREAIKPAAEG